MPNANEVELYVVASEQTQVHSRLLKVTYMWGNRMTNVKMCLLHSMRFAEIAQALAIFDWQVISRIESIDCRTLYLSRSDAHSYSKKNCMIDFLSVSFKY